MEIVDYSDKSIAVYGETKPWRENLKSLGGRFNQNLRDGPGWIFSKKHDDKVSSFVQRANDEYIEPMSKEDFFSTSNINLNNEMEIVDYSDKSIAVYGETKPWHKNLKSLGGRFNPNLKDGPGWIFSKKHDDKVSSFVQRANDGDIEPIE